MRLVSRGLFAVGLFSARVAMVFNYIAVGTLRLSDVKDAIRQSWEGFYGRDEDVASGLMDWERDLVDRFIPPGATVLVVGAGSGRDVVPLVERGCVVTGVEPAVTSLDVARRVLRERHLAATLLEGFLEDVDLPGRFDVVMFSFYSYSYIPGSQRRIAALRKAADHLNPAGHVLVSHAPLVPPHALLIALGRWAGTISRSDWRLEPGDLITAHSGGFRGYGHAFHSGELEREAATAGLRVVYRTDYPNPVAALTVAPVSAP